jgi:hypothetical protein
MPYRGVALQARILLPRLASVACLPLRARRSSRRRFRGVRVATRLHAPAGEQLDACMHACGQVEAAAERILHDDHINCLCVFSVHVLYFGENPDILLNAFCMMIKSTACASSP